MENHKIGIITFSNGYNYGAILQAYALQEYVKQLKYSPVIIDYLSDNFKKRYKLNAFEPSPKKTVINLLLLPAEIRKRRKIDCFRRKHFNIVPFEEVCANQIEYEQFITGSDQVWNPDITGMDDHFLLNWVNDDNKKSSYAASIGVDTLSNNQLQVLADNLASFSPEKICVREDGAKALIADTTGIGVSVVCDPTLLITADQWAKLADVDTSEKKYVLVYMFRTTKEKEKIILELAESRGLSIIWMRNPLKKTHGVKYINGLGIEEWLTYFMNADYVVTDSYHGFMFSLIFRKDFTILPLGKDKSNDRFITVLNRLKLLNRMSTGDSQWETSHIDYTEVQKLIEEYREESITKIKSLFQGMT